MNRLVESAAGRYEAAGSMTAGAQAMATQGRSIPGIAPTPVRQVSGAIGRLETLEKHADSIAHTLTALRDRVLGAVNDARDPDRPEATVPEGAPETVKLSATIERLAYRLRWLENLAAQLHEI